MTRTCPRCGKRFWVHAFRASTAKYCSKACWSDRVAAIPCEGCGNPFKPSKGTRTRFCSKHCAVTIMVGAKASRWKDGLSLHRERARHSNRLREWREAVYRRDDYTCQRCGARGVRLHAHHRQPFATCPSLRFDISNGETLCVGCHGKEHGKDFSPRRQRSDFGLFHARRDPRWWCLVIVAGTQSTPAS